MSNEINIKKTTSKGHLGNQEFIYGEFYQQIQDLKNKDGSYKLDDTSKQRLKRDTGEIFSQLTFKGDTGMIVGKIQSGKTMSFESLAGLARDNDVPLIIILAGISKILTAQTFDRLNNDFDVANQRHWDVQKTTISNPSYFEEINKAHRNWLDPQAPRKKAHIFVVMKNATHINQITNLCTKLDNINTIKTLIIDDESDQYSIDVSKKEGESSRIYSCIQNLRDVIPNHSFVQYTATPAANMLVALNDILSPDFAYNIDPGEGYTELQSLFPSNTDSPYIELINEVEADVDDDSKMPDQLKEALYTFLLGASAGYENNDNGNRSMLIHPSRLKAEHKKFYRWVKAETNLLEQVLENERNGYSDQSYKLKLDIFNNCYSNLLSTAGDLESLDDLMKRMIYVLRELKIELINSGKDSTATVIDWDKNYAQIICSGAAVDRGTTVEGLTITYMPRTSAGSQDTQIQRARFLGYRGGYKNLIRIYVDKISTRFYQNYHVAESSIRNLIDEHAGRPFKEAVREWKLVKGFASCREAAIKISGVHKFKATGKFVTPKQPHLGSSRVAQNLAAINDFISTHSFDDMNNDGWFGSTKARSHSEITVPIEDAYENLLSYFGFQDPKDARSWADLDLFMRHAYSPDESQEDYKVNIILMGNSSHSLNEFELRVRSENARCKERNCSGKQVEGSCDKCGAIYENSITDLSGILQGANKDKSIYPGDSEIYSRDELTFTIQIHLLTVLRRDGSVITNVPLIASRLPEDIWKRFDIQTASAKEEEVPDTSINATF